MSDAIKNAIEAMEFAQHAVGPFNRVATKKLRESIAELQAAQAQASKPIAAVTGWYDGRCVIEPLDRALAIPVGMALYSQPQAQAVNQQLLEALKKAERSLLSTMMAVTEPSPRRFKEQGWELVLDIKAAIAAAQEQSK